MCGNTDPYYVLMGRVIQKFRKAARMKQHELAADLKTTRGHIAASSELRRIFSPTSSTSSASNREPGDGTWRYA